MSNELEAHIAELKTTISNWPKEQKASFMNGIIEGLGVATLAAKQAGFNPSEQTAFVAFAEFLFANTLPPKTRKEGVLPPKTPRELLLEDVKELVRRAIAGRLRISKQSYDKSLDAEELVNRHLVTVMAIARRDALDDAIDDIRILRSIAGGGTIDRETVRHEVEACYGKFPTEVAAVTRYYELAKRSGFHENDIWHWMRCNVHVDYGHDDEHLQEIDSRYKKS